MSRAAIVLAAVVALSGASAQHAWAQPRPPRFTVSINGGAQAAMPSLSDRFTFELHAESATVDADHRVKAAPLVDGGFAMRIRNNIGVGIAVSRFGGGAAADIVAQMPSPFEFERFREVAGASASLDHSELAYHVQLQYSRPLSRRLRLVVAAGPTVFDVRRQLLESVQVTEEYPYETATFRGTTARVAKGIGVGFNVGADAVWQLGRSVGAGVLVRYARGTADIDGASRTATVDTGGLQSVAGLRVYF